MEETNTRLHATVEAGDAERDKVSQRIRMMEDEVRREKHQFEVRVHCHLWLLPTNTIAAAPAVFAHAFGPCHMKKT